MRIWPLRKRYTQVLFEASAGTGVYRLPLGNYTCLKHGKHPSLVAMGKKQGPRKHILVLCYLHFV